jgi:hypothetical protein
MRFPQTGGTIGTSEEMQSICYGRCCGVFIWQTARFVWGDFSFHEIALTALLRLSSINLQTADLFPLSKSFYWACSRGQKHKL